MFRKIRRKLHWKDVFKKVEPYASDYPLIILKTSLEDLLEEAFDFMFMNGEHGHDKKGFEGKHHWMMHRSLPPYMYVERDIESGFGGRLDKIINNRIEEILRK